MANDLRAKQIRTNQIIASGSVNSASLFIYGADAATSLTGEYRSTLLAGVGSDVFLFISGSTGSSGTTNRGVALVGGDLVASGTITSRSGISGSLTRLANGTSYLVAGSNITISTSSNGQVNISATGSPPGGSDTFVQFNDGGSTFGGDKGLRYEKLTQTLFVGNLTVTGSITSVTSSNLTVADPVILMASGSKTSNTNGGIAIASGSADANKALVWGRVANDTWGAGKLDVANGSTTSLTAMDLVAVRAAKYEIGGGASTYLTSSDGQGVQLSAATTLDLTFTDVSLSGNGTFSSYVGSYALKNFDTNENMVSITEPNDNADVIFEIGRPGLEAAELIVDGLIVASGSITSLLPYNSIKSEGGFSGSLTSLFDGRSYLVAGSNVTITSESNGQVRISSTGGSGTPGGSDTYLQFNDGGSFGGVVDLTFNKTSKVLTLTGSIAATGSIFHSGSAAFGSGSRATGAYSFAMGELSSATSRGSHAEGYFTTAGGSYAHSEGSLTRATGSYSHAEGYFTTASGSYSHAEGDRTVALGSYSHAEGDRTLAAGAQSHTEGYFTTGSGQYSHAEGMYSLALSFASHAEGYGTFASASYSHTEGRFTTGSGQYSHAEGLSTVASGQYAHSEGDRTLASNLGSHAEGLFTTASGFYSHAEGNRTLASGVYSHAEGYFTTASYDISHAEGRGSLASGYASHAEGFYTEASGYASHAEGYYTTASGDYSHASGQETQASAVLSRASGYRTVASAEGAYAVGSRTLASANYTRTAGLLTTASAAFSHAEGNRTLASGQYSHTEGLFTTASFFYAHAEGSGSIALNRSSHAEGTFTLAAGTGSHSQGLQTVAFGDHSFAGGIFTIASGSGQTVFGQYNLRDNVSSLFVVGNGIADDDLSRSDVLRVENRGIEVTGSVYASLGLSGSLTTLHDGRSYLVAGSNVTITSESNGQVFISSTGGGGTSDSYFSSPASGYLNTTGSTAFAGTKGTSYTAINAGPDVFFFVSGAIDSRGTSNPGTSVFGGDTLVSGSLYLASNTTSGYSTLGNNAGTLEVRNQTLGGTFLASVRTTIGNTANFLDVRPNGMAVNTKVAILPGIYAGAASPFTSTDTNFFVGGTAGSKGGSSGGTSVFGGDLQISGSTYIGTDATNSVYFQASLATDILPDGNRTRNLGSDNLRFANVYTGDLHLKNERGDYTLIEEEDCLTIRFNKTGKRYRFLLEPAPEYDEK